MESIPHPGTKAATGIEGLDKILGGGLLRNRIHLAQGGPGTGKTTLGLQFLSRGARGGERVLYITLSQTERELRDIAESHDWPLERVDLFELTLGDTPFGEERRQTLFRSADVELDDTTSELLEAIERVSPQRVVFDSIAEIRLLAGSRQRFRREIVQLKDFFSKRDCTVLLIDGDPDTSGDDELQILVHGVLELNRRVPNYGDERRRLQVLKMHGADYHSGYHDFRIRTGGLEVYPRLRVRNREKPGTRRTVESGVPELDKMLGGGLELGTASMITGPDGTGKTSLCTLYAYAAARRGQRSAIYIFDERRGTFFTRAEGLGMDFKPFEEEGVVTMRTISTGEISPGEFAHLVRHDTQEGGAEIVVIDGLSGYFNAMPGEQLLMIHMQELLSYLNRLEVLSLVVVPEQGIVGSMQHEEVDVGYMADTVLLLRHFEAKGAIRQAVSVIKKRHGAHEHTIRQLFLSEQGVRVGEPIHEFSGVLTGTPTFEGDFSAIIEEEEAT